MSVKLTGNWSGVSRLVRMLPIDVADAVKKRIKELGDELLAKIRQEVENQSLHLIPLSPDYLKRKLSEGLDKRTLIATHEYLDKLSVKVIDSRNENFNVFVGAFKSDIHIGSGLNMEELAQYLEEGTASIPARPHISVVWDQMKFQAHKDIVDTVVKAIVSSRRGI